MNASKAAPQSFSEQRFIQPAQTNDGLERAYRNLAPVGNRDSSTVSARQLPTVDEMAASLVDESETVCAQEPSDLASGKWSQFRAMLISANIFEVVSRCKFQDRLETQYWKLAARHLSSRG